MCHFRLPGIRVYNSSKQTYQLGTRSAPSSDSCFIFVYIRVPGSPTWKYIVKRNTYFDKCVMGSIYVITYRISMEQHNIDRHFIRVVSWLAKKHVTQIG